MTDEQKAQIVTLFHEGFGSATIACRTRVGCKAVISFLREQNLTRTKEQAHALLKTRKGPNRVGRPAGGKNGL